MPMTSLQKRYGAACPWRRLLLAALFTLSAASSALARDETADPSAAVADRYPHGSIQSAPAAKRALSEVKAARSEVAARFAAEQNACYSKFFAASCMSDAKEHKRAALARLREVEVDANFFLRKDRAAQRDRDVAQRRAKDESERAERERRAASVAAERARTADKQPPAHPAPQGKPDPDRVARHELELKRRREQEAADAPKRAANIAAYQKKVRKAQERQQEVARKKAEKERERAKKAAEKAAAQ